MCYVVVALFQPGGGGVSAFAQPSPFHSTGHHRTSSFGSGTSQLQAAPVSFHYGVEKVCTWFLTNECISLNK